MEAFETKLKSILWDALNDFKKSLLESLAKVNKMKFRILPINNRRNLKLQVEVTKNMIIATFHESGVY